MVDERTIIFFGNDADIGHLHIDHAGKSEIHRAVPARIGKRGRRAGANQLILNRVVGIVIRKYNSQRVHGLYRLLYGIGFDHFLGQHNLPGPDPCAGANHCNSPFAAVIVLRLRADDGTVFNHGV